jgi:hypothetical protein
VTDEDVGSGSWYGISPLIVVNDTIWATEKPLKLSLRQGNRIELRFPFTSDRDFAAGQLDFYKCFPYKNEIDTVPSNLMGVVETLLELIIIILAAVFVGRDSRLSD